MSEDLQKFSDDPEENFRMENEFLKMKIAAQFGGDFGAMEGLPPEIENQFLKNVLQFEDHTANHPAEMKKVSELIGDPQFAASADVTDDGMDAALKKVEEHYQQHHLNIDFIAEYPDRLKYEFLTGELLEHETDTSFMMPGMTWNFIYEEFHPNHAHDIEKQAAKFIDAWFNRDAEAFKYLLASQIPRGPQNILDQEAVIKKIGHLFDSFVSFENTASMMGQISYDMDVEQGLGMAFAEGAIKYDGIIENGETVHFEGPMKIYFALQDYYWDVMFFVMPGFEWGQG